MESVPQQPRHNLQGVGTELRPRHASPRQSHRVSSDHWIGRGKKLAHCSRMRESRVCSSWLPKRLLNRASSERIQKRAPHSSLDYRRRMCSRPEQQDQRPVRQRAETLRYMGPPRPGPLLNRPRGDKGSQPGKPSQANRGPKNQGRSRSQFASRVSSRRKQA